MIEKYYKEGTVGAYYWNWEDMTYCRQSDSEILYHLRWNEEQDWMYARKVKNQEYEKIDEDYKPAFEHYKNYVAEKILLGNG
jgi:hypothetical protein